MTRFKVPREWIRVTTIDAHTAGEPLRVITDGYPELPGETILDKRRHARKHLDHLRRALMLEPRGHADMYGCVLTPPVTADGDVGVLFLHNEGYSTMCGHGIIGLVKVGVECELFGRGPAFPVVRIDTPAGRVTATAHLGEDRENRVERVSFLDVPSFVVELDHLLDVPGLGRVRCDIAYGGAFYAYVDAESLPGGSMPLDGAHFAAIVDRGMRIKRALVDSYPLTHPDGGEDLNFFYGTIFTGRSPVPALHSRNVCVFAEGEVDRSPTGTGVSGRAAIHHARGELPPGKSIRIESLIGTTMDVRVTETVSVGGVPAVVPEVTGSAYVTGRHEFVIDPEDPLGAGVLLR